MTDRRLFACGAALAGTAVAAGAFGAHGLEGRLAPDLLEVFATAARYQLIHGVGLLAVALAAARWPSAGLELGGWLLVAGITAFAGSLYALALTGQRWLGAITPCGGALLIAGWAVLAWRVARPRSDAG
jgi:uncharacterized membrane protein YgdD (TMEM256/DUF423 family)